MHLDNISTSFVLQNVCKNINKPLVHGSIGGWFGQVSFIMPGEDTLSLLYPNAKNIKLKCSLCNPAFTPAVVASIQVAEAIKYLLKKGNLLQKKVLFIDLLNHDYNLVEF